MSESASTGEASVAIVVVNYNSATFIEAFCDSLKATAFSTWRLVVVDSGSTDGSMATIKAVFGGCASFTGLRCTENIGFAAGVNVPFDHELVDDVDFVLFLNPDTTLEPDFLTNMVAAADERTIVVPKILFAEDHRLVSTHAGGFDWRLGVFRDTFAGHPDGPATNVRRDDLATASFCCALVPRQAFRDAGRLDERFFMYYEETDWIRRAQAGGYRIRYEPSAVIYHRESGSSGGGWMTPFKQYYATRNRIYLVRKHARSRLDYARFTAYFLATRLITAAKMIVRRDWRLLRAMTKGTVDYYRGRMGRTVQVGDL